MIIGIDGMTCPVPTPDGPCGLPMFEDRDAEGGGEVWLRCNSHDPGQALSADSFWPAPPALPGDGALTTLELSIPATVADTQLRDLEARLGLPAGRIRRSSDDRVQLSTRNCRTLANLVEAVEFLREQQLPYRQTAVTSHTPAYPEAPRPAVSIETVLAAATTRARRTLAHIEYLSVDRGAAVMRCHCGGAIRNSTSDNVCDRCGQNDDDRVTV